GLRHAADGVASGASAAGVRDAGRHDGRGGGGRRAGDRRRGVPRWAERVHPVAPAAVAWGGPGTVRTVTSNGRVAVVDEAAVKACEEMFTRLGIVGDSKTARRHVRALMELTAGLRVDPARHLDVTFPPTSGEPGLVAVAGVPFTSVCAHHMLPFYGEAAVAYLPKPGARIVGLSK